MKKRGHRLLAWGARVGGAALLFWRLGGGLFPLSLAAAQPIGAGLLLALLALAAHAGRQGG
ncbi:hypothetical protein [Bittarella sp. HCP28S3_D9]|uniref:hypothetical protein n=1 Tax=Bittarella sp. HCP28S3_D9 TaxID=3440253 RepID=UPI003F8BC5B4